MPRSKIRQKDKLFLALQSETVCLHFSSCMFLSSNLPENITFHFILFDFAKAKLIIIIEI